METATVSHACGAFTFGELAVGLSLLVGCLIGIAARFGPVVNLNYLLAGVVSTNPIPGTPWTGSPVRVAPQQTVQPPAPKHEPVCNQAPDASAGHVERIQQNRPASRRAARV